jgi:hypothetical protein
VELGGRRVEIAIGTIVIEGMGRLDEGAVAAGVAGELVRMVGARGLPDELRSASGTLRATPFDAPAEVSGGGLGAAVGRAVYGALRP